MHTWGIRQQRPKILFSIAWLEFCRIFEKPLQFTKTWEIMYNLQGGWYVRRRYCNLRFSELARYIKVSFRYDLHICKKWAIWASRKRRNGHWCKLCQNRDFQKKLQIISSFQHDIALMHFSLQFVNVHRLIFLYIFYSAFRSTKITHLMLLFLEIWDLTFFWISGIS
jgi:hypothetical protein